MKRITILLLAITSLVQVACAQQQAITNASVLNVSTRANFYNDVPIRFGGSANFWIKYNSVSARWELSNPSNTLYYHNGSHGGIFGGLAIEGTSDGFIRTADATTGTSKDLLLYTGSAPSGRGRIYLGASGDTPTWVNEVWAQTPAAGDSSQRLATTGFVMRAIDGITGGSGSGTPAGATGHVQFNTNGDFDSSALFYYDKSMKWLWVPTVMSTDLFGIYGSIGRLEADSIDLASHVRLNYKSTLSGNIPSTGQLWVSSTDERPRYTDDGGYTFEMSLPGQASHNGKFLTTNGTTTSWAVPPPKAAGATGHVQFNTNGVLDSSSLFLYNKEEGHLWVPEEVFTKWLVGTNLSVKEAIVDSLFSNWCLYIAYKDNYVHRRPLNGQFWVHSADERPRYTDDGGNTFEISLPSQASQSGKYLTTNGTTTSWGTISKSTVGLGNVENTALTTWTGSSSITTLGTISTGTWSGSTIGVGKGGTGLTSIAAGSVLVANAANTISALNSTSGTYYLKNVDGNITWGTVTAGGTGTVTTVSAGNGMSFTDITSTGSVTLGIPSDITTTSTNSVSAGTHTHAIGIIGPAKGGTGVANNAANTISFTGNYALGLTLSGNTALTLPTSGTLVNSTVTSLSSLAGVGTITSGTWNGTAIADSYISSAATWNAKQGALPWTTSGDLVYYSTSPQRLAKGTDGQFLSLSSGIPVWSSISKTTVGLSAVENTALSTWAGSANLTTLGTISSGTWSGSTIGVSKGGTGLTAVAAGSVLVANSANTLSALTSTTGTYYLKNVDGTLSWGTVTAGGAGTVTNVSAGNGMSFTDITDSGSVSLGTPSDITSTSTNSVSTGSHTHAIGIISPAKGGTGVANGTNNTLSFTGNYSLGLTLSGNTALTLPTSGTLVNSAVTSLSSLAGVGTITSGTWNGTAIADSYIASAATWNAKLSSSWSGSTNLTTLGTISTGTWSATNISPLRGGTGVTNGANNTIAFTGNYSLGLTLTGSTSVTLPTSGTLITSNYWTDNTHFYLGTGTTRGDFYHTGSNMFLLNNAGNLYMTGTGASNNIYLNTTDGSTYSTGSTYTRTQTAGTNNNTIATTAFAMTAAANAAAGVTKSSIGLGNVENTQLSSWIGSANITQLGTITTGAWNGSTISPVYGGTGLSSIPAGSVLVAQSSNTLSALSSSSGTYVLQNSNGTLSWATAGGGSVATSAEVNTGTDNAKFISPAALAGSDYSASGTQTLSNKRITPRVGQTSSASSPTINSDIYDMYQIYALAVNCTLGSPTGTPSNGQRLLLKIKDNGTSRTLTWNSIFRPFGSTAISTSTVVGKWMYFSCVYNGYDAKWDVVGVAVEGGPAL